MLISIFYNFTNSLKSYIKIFLNVDSIQTQFKGLLQELYKLGEVLYLSIFAGYYALSELTLYLALSNFFGQI